MYATVVIYFAFVISTSSTHPRKPRTPEQAERHRQRNRKDNLSQAQIESRRARQQVANLSQEQIESRRARRQVANLSQEQIESRRARRQVANLSQEQIESRRAREQVANLSPAQIERYRARNRGNSRAAVSVAPGATAIVGYYGNGEEGMIITDEDNLPSTDARLPAINSSNESKEIYDMKQYIKFLDKGSDLRICFVCHEEHSAIFIGDKVYEPNDRMFDCLRPAPHARPIFAFDLDFAQRADIPLRVCKKCSASLKRGRVPPRSVKNFYVLDDEKFMKFLRNLDRIQARLIAKVIPIVTINIQKVYGDTNTVISQ
jgi:hypothetical protein